MRWPLFLPLLLAGCAAAPHSVVDACGYTWARVRPPARLVTVVIEPDWRTWPGTCKQFGARGCTTWHDMGDGATWAEIRIRFPPGEFHPCDPLTHEYRHAAGLDHAEPTMATPQDYTRR